MSYTEKTRNSSTSAENILYFRDFAEKLRSRKRFPPKYRSRRDAKDKKKKSGQS